MPTDVHQPTELESLRYLFQMLQGHFSGCMAIRSFDLGEADCTCHRAERLAAIAQFVPPLPPTTPDQETVEVAQRTDRQDRYLALWNGHISVTGDAALLLAQHKELGRECARLNAENSRYFRTLQARNQEIARLRRELYGPR